MMSDSVFVREITQSQQSLSLLGNEIAGTELHKLDEHDWAHACAMCLALPGLRGFWSQSAMAAGNPQGIDMSGHGYHLTNNNVARWSIEDLIPQVLFDGAAEYLSRADGGVGAWADITGTETYIASSQRGLTIGGWFKADDALPAAAEGLMGKWGAVLATQSYILGRLVNGRPYFGAASAIVANTVLSTEATSTTDWYFIVGRYEPVGPELKIWVNDTTWTTATAPASIQDTATAFTIGARGTPSNYFDGSTSLNFLCGMKVPDNTVTALFYQTRHMFGV